MLINLVPDFLAAVNPADPVAAYEAYYKSHGRLLEAYWRNYVIDPTAPQFADIVRTTITARRDDLRKLLERTDVLAIARTAEARSRALLGADVDFDVLLMVGVGAANAGELVVDGRGIAFVCLEHFTGVTNSDTHALGLDPELIPLWLSHEIAHVVRYTSPTSRSRMKELIEASGGSYSYWDTAREATLRELLVNEGLAIQTSRLASPGHAAWEYFGYGRREYARVRDLSTLAARAAAPDLETAGLGLRLRFLSGGVSASARTVDRVVLPERSGYYLGAQMVEAAIEQHGLAWAIRAPAEALESAVASIAIA